MTVANNSYLLSKAGKNNNNKREYLGKVLDNTDPKKLGRIKVMIDEIFKGLTKEQLPWIAYKCESDGAFFFAVPEINDTVTVKFDNDVYTGYYSTRIYSADQQLSEFDADYPKTVGYIVQKNNTIVYKLIINKEQETIHAEHSSGTTLDISKDGDISIHSKKSTSVTTDTDLTVSTSGSTDIITTGSTNIESGADLTVSTSGSTSIESSGIVDIKGSIIKLNS